MPEQLDEAIARAVKRFQLSKPLNVQSPQTVEEMAGAAVTGDTNEETVSVGIDQDSDSVVIVNPSTSEILSRKPRTEAYMQMLGATKTDHRFKKKLYEENLKSTQRHMKFSLAAASLGFLIVLGGVVAMMMGYSQAGIITAAAGVVSELVSVLFFNQARHFSQRLDDTLFRLLEIEGFFRAFAIAEQLPPGALRDQLFEAIVKKMIGIDDDQSVILEIEEGQ